MQEIEGNYLLQLGRARSTPRKEGTGRNGREMGGTSGGEKREAGRIEDRTKEDDRWRRRRERED